MLLAMFATAAAGDHPSLSAEAAEAVLREASVFRGAAVGYAGTTPGEVRAFRRVLGSRDGATRFGRVAARGTLAGRLYALCGLFFLDIPAFEKELARLRQTDATVQRQEGCIVFEESLSSVLASAPGAPRMSHSGSFREWLRIGFVASARDVAGGSTCYHLRFGNKVPDAWLKDPSRAPEGGPPADDESR